MPLDDHGYWSRRFGRRTALRGAGLAGAGLMGAALIGCGSDEDEDTPSGGGGGGGGGSTATATSTPQASTGPVQGGELTLSYGEPRSLDPHFDTFPANSAVVGNAYNTVLRFSEDSSQIEPELATALPEIPDDTTYVIKLHPGVKYQNIDPANGREMTSEDVKYSLERQMTDDAGKYQHAYYFKDKVTDIQTPDDSTVIIKTGQPYAPFISYLASPWTMIVNRETVEKHGDLTNVAVGTGPMIFKEWQQETHIKFERNPDYWEEGFPALDKLTFLVIADVETAATLFIDGKIDALSVDRQQFDRVNNARGADTNYKAAPSQFWRQFRMPPTTPDDPYPAPFDDIRVRQAIAQAIDKQQILDLVYSGDGQLAMGPILPQWTTWALTEELVPFDLDNAKKLMDAAGVSSFEGPMMWATNTAADQIGEIIKQQLAAINVTTNLEPMETAQYYNITYAYEYTFSHHVPLNNADPDENLSSYFGRNSTYFKHHNEAIWDIVDKQAQTVDLEERKEVVLEAQRMIVQDYPMRFILTPNVHHFVDKSVSGWSIPVDRYLGGMGRRAWKSA